VKWFRKYDYLILMAAVGLIYLGAVDRWQMLRDVLPGAQTRLSAGQERDGGVPETENNDLLENEPERLELEASIKDIPGINGEGQELGVPVGTEPMGTVSDTVRQEEPDPDASVQREPDPGVSAQGEQTPDGLAREESLPGESGAAEEPAQPVYVTVEDDYFSDALFIGDSRTVGMCEYGGLEETAAFYASTGLTIYKMFDAAIVEVPGQRQKITIEEALQESSFGKIYLMIGINEMGTGTVETFTKTYQEAVEHLRELQPEAIIYIQGILKVSSERSGQGDYINNEGIEARNLELEKLADNEHIFYLDVNPAVCDETGGLVDSYTFDGVHLKAKYIQIWKDYLKEHAVCQ